MTAGGAPEARAAARHERDYIERTIATVRNHRGADNCWPQWANIFADEIEACWAELAALQEKGQNLVDALGMERDLRKGTEARADELGRERENLKRLLVECAAARTAAEARSERAERRDGVFAEIAAERERQDAKWGGYDHDDGHGWHEWIDWIVEHAGKAYSPNNDEASYANGRRRYIEVAALAVAAVESMDRTVTPRAVLAAGESPMSPSSSGEQPPRDQWESCSCDRTFHDECPVHGIHGEGLGPSGSVSVAAGQADAPNERSGRPAVAVKGTDERAR